MFLICWSCWYPTFFSFILKHLKTFPLGKTKWGEDFFASWGSMPLSLGHLLDACWLLHFCPKLSNWLVFFCKFPMEKNPWNHDDSASALRIVMTIFNTQQILNSPGWAGGVFWACTFCMTSQHYLARNGGGIKNVGLCVLSYMICMWYMLNVQCICLIIYNIYVYIYIYIYIVATYFFSVFVPKRTSGSSPRLHWGSGLCQVCTGRSPPGRLQSTCIDMQQHKQSQLTTLHEILQPWYIYTYIYCIYMYTYIYIYIDVLRPTHKWRVLVIMPGIIK